MNRRNAYGYMISRSTNVGTAPSWWEYDRGGNPLVRVCRRCARRRLATFRPAVLTEAQQRTAFGQVLDDGEMPYTAVVDEDVAEHG